MVRLHPGRGSCKPDFIGFTTSPPSCRAFFAHTKIVCDQRVGVKDRLRFFDIVINSCCYVKFRAPHCLSIRFVPHGCVIPQAASYSDRSSGQSGLVASLARDFARVEHEGSDNRKQTSGEIIVQPLDSYWKLRLYIANLPPEGSKKPCIGNLPMHVLQDIVDMTGHQNFNSTPSTDRRMIGTPWHPARNCGHTWQTISLFVLPAGPNEKQ